MQIRGSYKLSAPPGRAYELLQDPVVLASCMPGCESLDKIGEATYKMKMKMVLAAVSGRFDGQVTISDPNPPESFRLTVEGKGRIGFMKGDGLLRLTPADDGTDVAYEGDVHVGGTIASVGQRLLDTTAKMMIKRFFDKLSEKASAAST